MATKGRDLDDIPTKPRVRAVLNERQTKTRLKKVQKSALTLRDELWPKLDEKKLWTRKKSHGFTTIPRTMPMFMEIINEASKRVSTGGKSVPAGRSYLVLWCRVFDECFVKIDNEAVAALEAGYAGERNITTWREHMRVLQKLGFIDFKEGASGPSHYVLLFNPYHVVRDLRAKKWVPTTTYAQLLERAAEIGAVDLEDDDSL